MELAQGVLRPAPLKGCASPSIRTAILGALERVNPGRGFREAVLPRLHPWRAYLQGGLVRNVLVSEVFRRAIPSRDIDVVVEGCPSRESLQLALSGFSTGCNTFGGFKVTLVDVDVDVWRLEDHRGGKRSSRTIEEVLASVTTRLDAVAYDLSGARLIDFGCREDAERRVLESPPGARWEPESAGHCLAHVAKLLHRTGFSLGPDLKAIVREHASGVALRRAGAFLERAMSRGRARSRLAALIRRGEG
ncbi:MAG: hypothetical protein ACREJI_05845 [Candidatus Methylomirabilales bacterium]